MKYLKKFEIHPEYTEFIETEEFIKPNVSCCTNETVLSKERELHYNKYYVDYLKFTALESGTIKLTMYSGVSTSDISYVEYSLDDGQTWTKTDNVDNTTVTITTPTLGIGDEVLWRGSGIRTRHNTIGSSVSYDTKFSSTCKCNVSGNINTLLGLYNPLSVECVELIYQNLFRGMTTLIDASELQLPFSTLAKYCYCGMFEDCTYLTSAPKLKATTLAYGCYSSMFYSCNRLVTPPPILPAITLADYCYSSMFVACRALTSTPKINATVLAEYCCQYMFKGCTNLTTVTTLPATILSTSCYISMFSGCTSLTTAPQLPATVLTTNCYESMFSGCTSLTTAPALPAITLKYYCYQNMFFGCTSLTTPPELPATTLAYSCYSHMFYGCTSLTTAPTLPAITLAGNSYNYMFCECTSLNYIKALFTTANSVSYNYRWAYHISSTGILVKNINAEWDVYYEYCQCSYWTLLYFDPATEKYYLSDKTTECDDHGNVI